MQAYEDPTNPGNSRAYHTGKRCIEPGCSNPAGTAWSHLWCMSCNIARMRRIDDSLRSMLRTVCAHDFEVTQQGVTYHDLRCKRCGETKRETWD